MGRPDRPIRGERRRDRASLIALFDGALGPSRAADYGTSFDEYGIWYLPYAINQNSGPTVSIPKLMEAQQLVRNAAEAQEYLDRLTAFPGILDGSLAKLQHDVALGAIPPDFIINKSKAVVDAFAAVPAKNNALYSSFVSKLKAANVPNADSFAERTPLRPSIEISVSTIEGYQARAPPALATTMRRDQFHAERN